MITTEEQAVISERQAVPVISWGAVLAGLVVIVGGTMLLTLLGAALGVSILDATDMDAEPEGLATGAAVWWILTTIAVNFVGGLLAAHLSGNMRSSSGIMHGAVVWALGFIAMVLIDTLALRSAASAGVAAAEQTASATASIGRSLASGIGSAADAGASVASGPYLDELRAELRRSVSKNVSEMEADGVGDVSARDVDKAIQNIDQELIEKVVADLVAGNTDEAQQTLLDELDLSGAEAKALIEGVEERTRQAANESEAVQEAKSWMTEQLDTAAAKASEAAGPEVSKGEIKDAVRQLDAETLSAAAQALLKDEPERAKNIIAANTDLNDKEIEAIIDGANGELREVREKIVSRFEAAVEKASDYAQAVLWTLFFGATLSLGSAAIGGYVGAGTRDEKYNATVTRRTTVT